MTRRKLPETRRGQTTKLTLSGSDQGRLVVDVYVTVNVCARTLTPMEIIGKATKGFQGHVDPLCTIASIALQHGVPATLIAGKLRGQRYMPEGGLGQPASIAAAIGLCLAASIAGVTVAEFQRLEREGRS